MTRLFALVAVTTTSATGTTVDWLVWTIANEMTFLTTLVTSSTSWCTAWCVVTLVWTFSGDMTFLSTSEAAISSWAGSLLSLVVKTSICLLESVSHHSVIFLTIVEFLKVAAAFPSTRRSSTLVLLFHTSVVSPLLTRRIFTSTSLTSTVGLHLLRLHVSVLLLLISVVAVNRATASTLPVCLIFLLTWSFFDLGNDLDIWSW